MRRSTQAALATFLLVAAIAVFFISRYYLEPMSIQREAFGRVVTSLADVPAFEAQGGGLAGPVELQWNYRLTPEICHELRDFGCVPGREPSGFRCIHEIKPIGWCYLYVNEAPDGSGSVVIVADGELLLASR